MLETLRFLNCPWPTLINVSVALFFKDTRFVPRVATLSAKSELLSVRSPRVKIAPPSLALLFVKLA